MPPLVTELIVPHRFNGPPSSGNGGWTAGALAGALAIDDPADFPGNRVDSWPAVEVSLRQPPPLDTPLHVEHDDQGVSATFGGAVIATARLVDTALTEVDPVPADEARAAESSYPGLTSHPFPTCFTCGTSRPDDDGLAIFGGPVGPPGDAGDAATGSSRLAAAWTPDRSLVEDWHTYVDDTPRASLSATWAALDCIGGWAGDMSERMMVLGRITARIDTLPVIGEEHVVVGAALGSEGRRTFTATTLWDGDGRVVGTAEQVWISVDPARFA